MLHCGINYVVDFSPKDKEIYETIVNTARVQSNTIHVNSEAQIALKRLRSVFALMLKYLIFNRV